MNKVRKARREKKLALQNAENWQGELSRLASQKSLKSVGQPQEIKDYRLARKLVKARRIFNNGGYELQLRFLATYDVAQNPIQELLDRL